MHLDANSMLDFAQNYPEKFSLETELDAIACELLVRLLASSSFYGGQSEIDVMDAKRDELVRRIADGAG